MPLKAAEQDSLTWQMLNTATEEFSGILLAGVNTTKLMLVGVNTTKLMLAVLSARNTTMPFQRVLQFSWKQISAKY
jgi:hypothetical protein